MKLINDKGKLFGIINVVDLLVLLAVCLVVAGVGWRILGPKISQAAAPTTKVTITMRVRGAHPRQLNEMLKHVPSQLVSGNEFVGGANLIKVESEPYVVQIPTDDGKMVDATDPTRIDIIFTIEAKVPTGGAATKIGTQEVRAGRDFTVKTRYIEQIAIIETIEYENEEAQ
jgi:hypothetical protein